MDSADLLNARQFYESVRQYIIYLLTFIGLYFSSYLLISRFKKKMQELSDYEDDLVYRIALWLSCFTMTVSIGAVLLLPFSIFSNEILLAYPDSYYTKWLNASLHHGLWNQIFLGTYIALFFAMPFAYFLTEAEGFAGSRKGIRARIYETCAVLVLLLVLTASFVWVFSAFLSREGLGWIAAVHETWAPPLPFIYSCISLLGALVLLICTPLGFTRLFSVLGQYVVRPKFFVDLDDQIQAIVYEEEEIKRRSNGVKVIGLYVQTKILDSEKSQRLAELYAQRRKLERERDASALEKNLLFPICLICLLALTVVCLVMVAFNILDLLLVDDAMPFRHKYPSFGKISFSRLGKLGAVVQIIIIFYVMAASLVGLYSSPFFSHLRPRVKQTSLTKIIVNCVILLILSSALPVFVRTLGITTFDLMGEFGRLHWIGNFRLVFSYNLLFGVSTSLCLVNKFTSSVRQALLRSFRETSLLRAWRTKRKGA